jgi:hypothetical protein
MFFYIMLNYVMHEVQCPKYYLPFVYTDLRNCNILCEDVNNFMMLMINPRINIDMISSRNRFYFTENHDNVCGEVFPRCMIVYNINDPTNINEIPCILYLEGRQLVSIMIYIPNQATCYLQEFRYRTHSRRSGQCPICFDDNQSLINLHNDEFCHEVCCLCLYRIENCPLCRIPLLSH